MARLRPFKWAYVGLWLVRTWFALYGMGYIHPDEHMQNGEVTAGTLVLVQISLLLTIASKGIYSGFMP